MTASARAIGDHEDPRLQAAQKRLRESVGPADLLDAVCDIVTNLLGCEEIGLFTLDRGSSRLFWSFGIDPKRHGSLDTVEVSTLQRVLQGEFQVTQVHEGQANHVKRSLRVLVPIRVDERTVAVLVMFKLLPQKPDFDETDIKLAKLLSDETGRALFGSASANA